jgi:hypothetical protein
MGSDLSYRGQWSLQDLEPIGLLNFHALCGSRIQGSRTGSIGHFCLFVWVGFRPLYDHHLTYGFSCCHDIERERLARLRSHHDQWRCKVPLELRKCLFCLLSPDKGSGHPQKLEEQESPLNQSRDKLTQRGEASRELLHIFDAGWRPHLFDRLDLLRVGLDPSV